MRSALESGWWRKWSRCGPRDQGMENRILLLEDDEQLIDGLAYTLEKNGFALELARTVAEAYGLLEKKAFDLLLLDITLPDGSGLDVCSRLRRDKNPVPIIFLTAMDEEVNIIRGLDSGADDYITKPFKLGELCSRIRALLRRSGRAYDADEGLLSSGPVTIEPAAGRVLLHGQALTLTGAEFRLLCLLVKNEGNTLTRNVILDELWDGSGNFVDDNTLSVYIRRLREKLEKEPSKPEHLLTVRGFGYQWRG